MKTINYIFVVISALFVVSMLYFFWEDFELMPRPLPFFVGYGIGEFAYRFYKISE